MVSPLWQDLVSLCSWQVPDWDICPNWLDPFCRVSWVLVSDTYEILLVSHCSEDGMVQRWYNHCWVVGELDPSEDSWTQCHFLIKCIWAHVHWKVVINECGHYSVCWLIWYGKGFQPSCEMINDGENMLVPWSRSFTFCCQIYGDFVKWSVWYLPFAKG